MDKEDMVHINNEILLSQKSENFVICRDMDRPRDCLTEWSKSQREEQILHYILMHICGIWKKNGKDLICRTERETQM